MRYNIVVWPRNSAQLTFKELADSFMEVLSKNYECKRDDNFSFDKQTINIIFGANDYLFVKLEIPLNSIIINLEQLGKDQYWNKKEYMDLLKKYPVWDYTNSNISFLKTLGIENVKKIQIGYTKSLETCSMLNDNKNIDVLFYGALNERRKNIMIRLKALGYTVVYTANAFGTDRDRLISQSKIVLNIHYFSSKILEVVRISHLLANKKCVISERGSEDDVNKVWCAGVVMCDYDEIVSNVMIYLFNDAKRQRQEYEGYKFIKQHPMILPIEYTILSYEN